MTNCFRDSKDVDSNAEILKHIYTLQLNKVVGEYKINIDYNLQIIEIHKNNKFVILKNFNSCEGKIWATILEDIKKYNMKNGENKH